MADALKLQINGEMRNFDELANGAALAELIVSMGLKPDRIAVELNGEIAARSQWAELRLHDGDRLEIVHFVGGGSAARRP